MRAFLSRMLALAICLSFTGWVNAAEQAVKLSPPPGPSLTSSLIRLVGGLFVVFGLFLGVIWLLKRAPMLTRKGGDTRKLNVLEVRSLAPRQALYVIGYERQRYLLASTPTGVSLLTALPVAETDELPTGKTASVGFAEALMQAVQKQN